MELSNTTRVGVVGYPAACSMCCRRVDAGVAVPGPAWPSAGRAARQGGTFLIRYRHGRACPAGVTAERWCDAKRRTPTKIMRAEPPFGRRPVWVPVVQVHRCGRSGEPPVLRGRGARVLIGPGDGDGGGTGGSPSSAAGIVTPPGRPGSVACGRH